MFKINRLVAKQAFRTCLPNHLCTGFYVDPNTLFVPPKPLDMMMVPPTVYMGQFQPVREFASSHSPPGEM